MSDPLAWGLGRDTYVHVSYKRMSAKKYMYPMIRTVETDGSRCQSPLVMIQQVCQFCCLVSLPPFQRPVRILLLVKGNSD